MKGFTRRTPAGWRLAILCAPLLAPSAALAAPFLTARLQLNDTGTMYDNEVIGTTGTASLSNSFPNASGSVFSDYGLIKLGGAATGGPLSFGGSIQTGQFSDSMTLSVPGVPIGAQLTTRFGVYAGFQLTADGADMATESDWSVMVNIGVDPSTIGVLGVNLSGQAKSASGYSGASMGLHTYTLIFNNGTTYQMETTVRGASATAEFIAGGTATDDLTHSFYWGGFSNTMYNGNPAGPINVTSLSGTDWSQSFIPSTTAAPEPGTAGLAGGALAGGFLLIRRRRRA